MKFFYFLSSAITVCLFLSIPINTFAYANNEHNYLSTLSSQGTTLTSRQQQIYNKIYNALISLDSSISLSEFSSVSADEVNSILDNVISDHPEIFYFFMSYYDKDKDENQTINFIYTDTKENSYLLLTNLIIKCIKLYHQSFLMI
ncbi:MAG: hypothetical protein Q8936_08695 [Bacillota bacterium]|nr:hypothetical protein [Bacillota bacterium]